MNERITSRYRAITRRPYRSPCPIVNCKSCDEAQDSGVAVLCKAKGHYIWEPYKKRSCCWWIAKGQTKLDTLSTGG